MITNVSSIRPIDLNTDRSVNILAQNMHYELKTFISQLDSNALDSTDLGKLAQTIVQLNKLSKEVEQC
jgi:hypothetical protein